MSEPRPAWYPPVPQLPPAERRQHRLADSDYDAGMSTAAYQAAGWPAQRLRALLARRVPTAMAGYGPLFALEHDWGIIDQLADMLIRMGECPIVAPGA